MKLASMIHKHSCQTMCNRYLIITEKKGSLDNVDTIYNEFFEQCSQTGFCMEY